VTATPARLPRDLQGRLDVILAKPLLRRCPKLQQAIEILVRNAYERRPPMPLQTAPFETGAPWRGSAEIEWDASRDYEHRDGAL
jgi:hypothetical protein